MFGPGVTVEDNARDPLLLASRRRACRQGRVGRAVRAAAAGREARREVAHRQFRRGEGSRASRTAPRPITSPISATRSVGAGANIGAGTITCNYDGVGQAPHRDRQGRVHRLELGAGRAGEDRRRRLCRLGLGDHRGRAGRTRWRSGAGGRSIKEGWAEAPARAKRRRRKRRSAARRRISRADKALTICDRSFDCHKRNAL